MSQFFQDQLTATANAVIDDIGVSMLYTHANGSSETIDAGFVNNDFNSRSSHLEKEFDKTRSDLVVVLIQKSVIANPSYGDTITYDSVEYRFVKKTSAGGLWRVYCSNEDRLLE